MGVKQAKYPKQSAGSLFTLQLIRARCRVRSPQWKDSRNGDAQDAPYHNKAGSCFFITKYFLLAFISLQRRQFAINLYFARGYTSVPASENAKVACQDSFHSGVSFQKKKKNNGIIPSRMWIKNAKTKLWHLDVNSHVSITIYLVTD